MGRTIPSFRMALEM
jgi:hypothetical protein